MNEDKIVQKETIKLMRGTKGGYSWEIKYFAENKEKLEEVNAEYEKKYGGNYE